MDVPGVNGLHAVMGQFLAAAGEWLGIMALIVMAALLVIVWYSLRERDHAASFDSRHPLPSDDADPLYPEVQSPEA